MHTHFQHIVLYYFQNSKNTTETQKKKKICAVYGEGAVTDRTCQNWFAKFHAGNFLLDDVPQSGRPLEVDRDQIKTLTENNQRSTTREIANILRIPKSMKSLVKMKNGSYFMENTIWTFGQLNI